MLLQLVDIILHLNLYLGQIINDYHYWTYGIIAAILFCETGLVITPFLPGDSLLFATGSVFASSTLNIHLMFALAMLAVFAGDNCNYWIGRWAGKQLVQRTRIIKAEHLAKTHTFYETYGPQALIIARFIPIVRTFMPFVAGMSTMTYIRFIAFSILAALLWVGVLLYTGFWLGSIPIVKQHFSWIILAIIILSLLPAIVTFLKHYRKG